MKILVIQITRFGDILCTLPVLAALRRTHPHAEIHFLVRKKFAEAAHFSSSVDHLWTLDSADLLGGLITSQESITDVLEKLSRFIVPLRQEKFDRVINLSFSPSSSFISHLIAQEKIPVYGYTRTEDFFLRIPDIPSCYFKSHVGPEKNNRLPVSDLMAWIAGAHLTQADWRQFACETPKRDSEKLNSDLKAGEKASLVVHLGANESHKQWPAFYWMRFLDGALKVFSGSITLVGAQRERMLADDVLKGVAASASSSAFSRLVNLVGQTNVTQLFDIIKNAPIFMGADSGPLHIANLVNKKTLNLSLGRVRFWETGPLTVGSRVLIGSQAVSVTPEFAIKQLEEMLSGRNSRWGFAECVSDHGVRYEIHPGAPVRRDAWTMVEWLHFDGEVPLISDPQLREALMRIKEACDITVTQLETFYLKPHKKEIIGILDRLDEVLKVFQTNFGPLSPLLDLFFTEKENIPPGSREEIFYQTKKCYLSLDHHATKLLQAAAVAHAVVGIDTGSTQTSQSPQNSKINPEDDKRDKRKDAENGRRA